MGRSELAAQQRMQLEAVLEEFENALRSSTNGDLPEVEMYLTGFEGDARAYLEREMRNLVRDLVRGNYIVLNPIESGGMGSISRVRHLRLGKVMALKEIRSEALQIGDQQEILRRFRREIEVCGRLDEHPNIVSYTDTGVNESGVPFLVMDYIDGEDLGKIVRRVGPLSIADAARVIHDAAIGLAHAHDNGLVHRDVKPSNIMVSRHGTVKVLDFGLARITNAEHHLTALTTGKVMGTFDYMSPELCRETTPDSRGDIYSLGCTFYFLLAGHAPFEGSKSQFDKMNAHLHNEPPPIPRLEDEAEIRGILQKMMAKTPEARYQDLHEVADALRPFCAGTDLRALVRSEKGRRGRDGTSGGAILLRTDRPHDSSERTTDSKAGDHTAEWSRARRKRSRRYLWTASLVAVGLVLAATLLISDQWRRVEHRRQMANVLGTLPGLNGRWWFDEAPWLLPEVRLQLADSLADADPAMRANLLALLYESGDAPAAYDQISEAVERFRRNWPADVARRLATVEGLEPEYTGAESLASSLRDMARQLDSKAETEPLTGAESHLRAVIHHHLEEFEPAAEAYETAAQRYAEEGAPALRALALLDWGELLHSFRQPAGAQAKLRESRTSLQDALHGQPLPPLFELYAKATEADAHRRIDNMPEAERLLSEAWKVAQTLPADHPLRAYVLERRGWFHLDNWRLEEAQEDFEKALAIRESHEPDNYRARHFIYWDRQGVAMAQMYAGQAMAARRLFQDLLDQIRPQQGVTPKQLREMEDRRPNLYERLADTALFSGLDASDDPSINPAEELDRAIEYAQRQDFSTDGRKAILIRLQYKVAAVHAIRDQLENARQHQSEARQLEPDSSTSGAAGDSSPNGRASTYALTKEIAEAALAWRSDDSERQADGRRRLLELMNEAGSDLPRDDLLLLLYVGENLLEEDLPPSERTNLAKQMLRVIGEQRFPPQEPSSPASAPKVPGVFTRYLEMARAVVEAKE